jgi:uncharacterized protein (TIGR03435 family)
MTRISAGWILAAILAVGAVTAQERKPRFEVVSVKPQREPINAATLRGAAPRVMPGGVFNPTRASVLSLLTFAYDLKPYQILGGPDWMRRDVFHIDARAGFDAPADQIKQMVQSLLEDRFKLITHKEQRDMPYLALVVARSDGRLGPYLRELPDDCTPAAAAEARKQFPPRPRVDGPVMSAQCAPMSAVVNTLTALSMSASSPPLVDETNLRGKFVMEMKASSMVPGTIEPPAGASDPSLPSFTTALEEQLGLKLEERRGPIDVLVIDSVQQPTEN